ncbi:MAG: hypothetical protein Q7S43_00920 [bacterium]|nr:hypothetical protein [bacterium]
MANVNLTKKTWILLGIYIATAVIGLVVLSSSTNKQKAAESLKETIKEESTGSAPVEGGTTQQLKTYNQLLKDFTGRRVQFDARCQAIPNDLTYKNGTQIMFDNRSGDARWISVGGAEYYLSGYGYKILTLSSKSLPKNLYINCGSAVNVGQILLQR